MAGFLDRITERASRGVARNASRRAMLTRLGLVLCGGMALPLLPVARLLAEQPPPDADLAGAEGDPQQCEYWRYCSLGGHLCSCCGGSASSCPPGSELSQVAWVGTCRHPSDGLHYVISYHDCCGKGDCGRCSCGRNEGDKPVYVPSKANDITWCFGTQSNAYHCTLAAVVGVSEEAG